MKRQIEIDDRDYLETLRRCGGFYRCPTRAGTGGRMGPLVGYAGKYQAPDGLQKQWVGEIYANFAKAEVCSDVLRSFAGRLFGRLHGELGTASMDAFCGTPIGGYALATALGLLTGFDVIKAEKKVTALATPTEREKSKLVFGRHSVERGLRYVIVEDVCNNFSTTAELIELIMSFGGEVVAVACFLNRSLTVDSEYRLPLDEANVLKLPVVSLVRLPIDEWRQDDPAVAEDVAKGNVAWKPKDEWDRLMKAMQGAG